MKKIVRILVFLLLAVAVVSGIAWKLGENKKVIEANAQAAQVGTTAVLVTTTQPAKRQLKSDFNVTGELKPFRSAAIVAETSGRLVQLNIDNGSYVSTGQVIAVIDNELIRNQIEMAKANIAKAKTDVSRLSNLAAEGGVSQQQLDDARINVTNQEIQLRGLEKQLSMAYVKAPFAGTITGKAVERGSFVSPPAKIADLVQTSQLLMQAYVLEDQVIDLKVGQTAKIVMDLQQDQPLTGRITFIDVQADPSQRYLVELEVKNPGQLRGGMSGQVQFSGKKDVEALTVPRDCIVGSLRDAKVYVVENGKAVLRPITVGRVQDEYVQVTDGLTTEDVVVLTGQINLSEGAEVSVQE